MLSLSNTKLNLIIMKYQMQILLVGMALMTLVNYAIGSSGTNHNAILVFNIVLLLVGLRIVFYGFQPPGQGTWIQRYQHRNQLFRKRWER